MVIYLIAIIVYWLMHSFLLKIRNLQDFFLLVLLLLFLLAWASKRLIVAANFNVFLKIWNRNYTVP